jgi:hypothetical protein
VQDPIAHEDSSGSFAEDAKFEENREVIIDPAVDAGFGETRGRRDGRAGGCGNRGNSENRQPEPRERGFGATRDPNPRQSRKVRNAGQPADHTGRRCWKSQAAGETRSSSASKRRRTRDSGQLEDPLPAQPEDAGTGETRGLIGRRNWKSEAVGATRGLMSRSAEGCEIRGNSKLHCRQGRKMQEPGQPGNSSTGATGGAKPRGNPKLHRWKR